MLLIQKKNALYIRIFSKIQSTSKVLHCTAFAVNSNLKLEINIVDGFVSVIDSKETRDQWDCT